MYRKWPPVPNMPFISLATVDKEGPMSHSEVNERAMFASQGQINEIPSNDGPLGLDDVLKSDDNEFLRCVLVEGAPGIGKSTFAWELCHQWDEIPNLRKYDLILLVPLKETAVHQNPTTWKNLILFKHPSVEAVKNHIESNDGAGVLWILDGFDELSPNDRDERSLNMDLITGKVLPASTVIVTSRSSAAGSLQGSGKIDRHLEILGFTTNTIIDYVKSYFRERNDMLLSFLICHVFQSNLELTKLMYIPLNAAIVCLMHEENYGRASFQTLTELYNGLTCALIKRHLEIEKIPQLFCERDIQEYLPSEFHPKFLNLLKMAYDGILTQKFVFTASLDDHLGLMNVVSSSRFGLSGEHSFYFLHSSLQEYLAALHCTMQTGTHAYEIWNFHTLFFPFFIGIAGKVQPELVALGMEVVEKRLLSASCIYMYNGSNDELMKWSHVFLECFRQYPNVMSSFDSNSVLIKLNSIFSPESDFSLAGSMLSRYSIELFLTIVTASQLHDIAKPFFENSDAPGRINELKIIGLYDIVDLQKILSCDVVSTLNITIRHQSEFQEIFAGLKSVENLHNLILHSYDYTIQYPVFNVLDKMVHLSQLSIDTSKVEINEASLDTLEKAIKEQKNLGTVCLAPVCDSSATLNRFLRLVFGPSSLYGVFLYFVNFEECPDEVFSILEHNTSIYLLGLCCCRITKRLTIAMLKSSSLKLISIKYHDYHTLPMPHPCFPTDNSEVPGLIELVKKCSPPLKDLEIHRVFTPEESIEIVRAALYNQCLSRFGVYDVTFDEFSKVHIDGEHKDIDTSKICQEQYDKGILKEASAMFALLPEIQAQFFENYKRFRAGLNMYC